MGSLYPHIDATYWPVNQVSETQITCGQLLDLGRASNT